MNQKIEKIKKHFRENKKVYISGSVCLVVGLATGALAFRSNALVNAKPIQVLTWKSKQTIEVFVEALGDPGNIIQDTTTGIIYASQGQVAKALDVDPSTVSRHLSGILPTVKGHTLINLGKAMVTQE